MNYDNPYDKHSNVSAYWYNHVSDLKAAAAAVHYSLDKDVGKEIISKYFLGTGFSKDAAVTRVWKMLAGLSLELLYKAIYVERKIEFSKVHFLREFNDGLKIILPAEFYPMLDIFTEHIIWDSKYPVPKKIKDYDKQINLYKKHVMTERIEGGRFKIRRNNGFLSWENYDNLWEIIEEVYFSEKKDLKIIERALKKEVAGK